MTTQQKSALEGVIWLHLGLVVVAGLAALGGGSFLRALAVTQLIALAFWLFAFAVVCFKAAADKEPRP